MAGRCKEYLVKINVKTGEREMTAKNEYPLVNETKVVTGLYSQGGSDKDTFITVLNRTPRL